MKRARRRESTVGDVVHAYFVEHVSIHNKPSTAAEVRRKVQRRIKPGSGLIKITALKRADAGLALASPYERHALRS